MNWQWLSPAVALLTLALDLASKAWARAYLCGGRSLPLLPGFLRLSLTTNTGAAFGMGRDNGALVTGLAILITACLVIWIGQRERSGSPPGLTERLAIGLLLGGSLGNLWERLSVGRVTDFLEFTFISFPVFNLADVSIDLGAFLIMAVYLTRAPVCIFAQSLAEAGKLGTPDSRATGEDQERTPQTADHNKNERLSSDRMSEQRQGPKPDQASDVKRSTQAREKNEPGATD